MSGITRKNPIRKGGILYFYPVMLDWNQKFLLIFGLTQREEWGFMKKFGFMDWVRFARRMTPRKALCVLSCCRWPLLCGFDQSVRAVRAVGSVEITCGRGRRYTNRVLSGVAEPRSRKKVR